MAEMNTFLKNTQDLDFESQSSDEDETGDQNTGETLKLEEVDHEAEYIDEEKYTTVVVETMDLARDELEETEKHSKQHAHGDDEVTAPNKDKSRRARITEKSKDKKVKKKKKKFRYETKSERRISRMKETSKNSKEAKARRSA